MKWDKPEIKKLKCALTGIICGFLNGFFGAGGGTVVVPLLRKDGLDDKKAHATSVAVILPVTLVSVAFYLARGDVSVKDSLGFVIAGIPGAAAGAFLLKKISSLWLRRIFGALIILAAVRMFLK